MNLLSRLGLHLAGKRILTSRRLRREGRATFARLLNGRGPSVMALHGEEMQRRIHECMEVFTLAAHWLNLPDTRPPLNILDLGSYNGMWPFVCSSHGHRAIATDLPATFERPEVQAMLELLEVEHLPLRVEPMRPLPDLPVMPDLITGFRTRFHSTKPEETGLDRETHWGESEWTFFLRDAAARLSPRGRMFFMLNRLQEKGRGGWVPSNLAALFADLGGSLRGPWLRFDRLDRLR